MIGTDTGTIPALIFALLVLPLTAVRYARRTGQMRALVVATLIYPVAIAVSLLGLPLSGYLQLRIDAVFWFALVHMVGMGWTVFLIVPIAFLPWPGLRASSGHRDA